MRDADRQVTRPFNDEIVGRMKNRGVLDSQAHFARRFGIRLFPVPVPVMVVVVGDGRREFVGRGIHLKGVAVVPPMSMEASVLTMMMVRRKRMDLHGKQAEQRQQSNENSHRTTLRTMGFTHVPHYLTTFPSLN